MTAHRSPESTTSDESNDTEQRLRAVILSGFPAAVADLASLVRIPSVAVLDPAAVERSAEAVARLARELCVFDEVDIVRAPIDRAEPDILGMPAVIAHRPAPPGAPTVLLYAHHDVQPAGSITDWESDPYQPTVRGDRLYGRGTGDDKAGVITHLSAVRALSEVFGTELPCGLTLFIEGEEEGGPSSLHSLLQEHEGRLRADVIVAADSDNWDAHTPAITVSLRGFMNFTLTVSTLHHGVHSGMFGGAVPDAMLAAISLLSTLHDSAGQVIVPGLSEAHFSAPDYSEDQLRNEAGLLSGVQLIGSGVLPGRVWWRPSITVTGVDAPSVAAASNTLLPSVRFNVEVRVAPGQKAADAFEAVKKHLHDNAPFGAQLQIDDVELGDPFLADPHGRALSTMTACMADAWEADPVHKGIGGSIPFLADLEKQFPGSHILVTGALDPQSQPHGPNESVHLGALRRAILSEALFLARIGAH